MRPVIKLAPFSGTAALQVLQALDEHDYLEALHMRADGAEPLAMYGDWRNVTITGGRGYIAQQHFDNRLPVPFALMAMTTAGLPYVGQVAMVAKSHVAWRRQLTILARIIHHQLPIDARAMGFSRLEVRAFAEHPTAASLLRAIGFQLEAHMSGFGPEGVLNFDQWAMTVAHQPYGG